MLAVGDEDLGWVDAGVVVGGQGHAVGAGVEEDGEVAGAELGGVRSRAKKSPVSQTGPTMSAVWVGRAASASTGRISW